MIYIDSFDSIAPGAENMAIAMPPPVPTGEIKSFGRFGPKYQVGEPLRQREDGEWVIGVTLVETGETTEYILNQINRDPDAI